jgi:TetR/AcrR family transcriptional regulator, lmrAB and yxaGH operons repressor
MADVRRNMARAAAHALGRQSIADTTLSGVVKDAGAARGSLYHFYPGGKDQLVMDAVELVDEWAVTKLGEARAATPEEAGAVFLDLFRGLMDDDDASSCPITTVVVDDGTGPLRERAALTFTHWRAAFADLLRRTGMPARESESVAALFLAACEGGLVMARAGRDRSAFEAVAEALTKDLRLRTAR